MPFDELIAMSVLGDVDPVVDAPGQTVGFVFDVAIAHRELVEHDLFEIGLAVATGSGWIQLAVGVALAIALGLWFWRSFSEDETEES